MERSEEILNVKCLEYSSLSWARSVLANVRAIKWAKAEVCVHADSVLCVVQMKDSPVGIDGDAIEFEWENFPAFSSLSILQEIRQEKEHPARGAQGLDHLPCQCSMTLNGKRMMRIVLDCLKSQELLNEILARTLDMEWK